jgi:competence protein ComEC
LAAGQGFEAIFTGNLLKSLGFNSTGIFEQPEMKSISRETSKTRFTLYPLAWLAAAFTLGIILSSQITLSMWLLAGVELLLLAGTVILLKNKRLASIGTLMVFAVLGALLYTAETGSIKSDRVKLLYDSGQIASGEEVKVTGTVSREPEFAINGFFLWLNSESLAYRGGGRKVSGAVRLFVPVASEADKQEYEALDLKAGDRVEAAAALKRDERFLNPGVRPAKENLDRQGIDATGTIKTPEDLKKTGEAAPLSPPLLMTFVYRWRQKLLAEFQRNFNVPTAGVMAASLLGNKYYLDKPTAEAFREGGTFHILVISGAHITLLGALAVWLLSFVTKNRLWLFLISNAALWAYALAVGGDAPVARAAVMFSILSFSYVAQRRGTLLNSLGASALVLLAWKPSDVFDPSFQLTFACVFAIVAAALPLLQKLEAIGKWRPSAKEPLPPRCPKWLKTFCEILFWSEAKWRAEQKRSVWQCNLFKTPWAAKLERTGGQIVLRYLFAAMAISVIVQLWLAPFLIVYFHRISPAGIVLNLFVGLLLAAETAVALFAVLLAQASQAMAAPFIWLTESLNWLMLHSVDPFDAYDVAALRMPAYSGWARIIYLLYFIPLVFLWRRLSGWNPFAGKHAGRRGKEKRGRRKIVLTPQFSGAALLILLLAIIFHPFSAPRADGNLRIDFLDVGQGDSALLTFPDGETMLIDGGGKFNFSQTKVTGENGEPVNFEPDVPTIGESVVSQFLWNRGLSGVDYLLASHGDIDHIQGLNDAARNFDVRAAFVGAGQEPSANLKQFYETLARENIPVIETARGDVFIIGGTKLEILSPSAETMRLKENNNSLVVRVTFGERSFLFTGDIEREAEEILLRDAEKLRCDVVKVAHHGSRSSSTENFVNATGAKTAVISVGRDSPFGHPHREVIERWQRSGANTMTTGSKGTITIITDGQNFVLNSCLGN